MAKKSLSQIRVELFKLTEIEVKKFTLEMHNQLVINTPIKTGWASSNWLLSTVKPIETAVGSKSKVDTSMRSAGVGAVIGWKFGQGPIYDTNNVPYIKDLNEGSSSQAPAAFVETTIQSVLNKFNNRKKLG